MVAGGVIDGLTATSDGVSHRKAVSSAFGAEGASGLATGSGRDGDALSSGDGSMGVNVLAFAVLIS